MSKYSIETVYTCVNDDTGNKVFVVENDADGNGLIHIDTPNGDLTSDETGLLIKALQHKIADNKEFMS